MPPFFLPLVYHLFFCTNSRKQKFTTAIVSSTSGQSRRTKVLVFGENHIGTALASAFCGLCQIDFIFFQDRLLKNERERYQRYQLSEKKRPRFFFGNPTQNPSWFWRANYGKNHSRHFTCYSKQPMFFMDVWWFPTIVESKDLVSSSNC